MFFKLTSVVCSEDQVRDVMGDFQTKVDQWHRTTSISFRGSRRKIQEKYCPNQIDQEEMPPPDSEQSTPIITLNNSFTSNTKNKEYEDFGPTIPLTLVDSRPIRCSELKSRKIEPKIEPKIDTGRKTELTKFIELEKWVNEPSRDMSIEMQRRHIEEQNAFIRSNLRRRIQPVSQVTQKVFPMPNLNGKPKPQNTPITLFYSNQQCAQGQWSIIWNIEKYQNIPLILDRNDKYIVLSDKLDSGERKKRSLRQWDKLEILPPNDNYYLQLTTKKTEGKNVDIQHSNTALSLALIQPTVEDFENFHRPKFLRPSVLQSRLNQEFKLVGIVDTQPHDDEHLISPYLKELDDLSARNGIVYVVEHTVEVPPLMMNVGMSSLLITYWHKENPNDTPPKYDKTMKILEPDDESPFTAQIPNNKGVLAITNLLYRVPVFRHELHDQNDFLLIKSAKDDKQFYVRKFNAIFCAGMLEPLKVVMQPSLKETQKFIERFTKAMLINIFRGTKQYKGRNRFTLAKIQQEYFPEMNETKLRKIVQNYAIFSREQTKRIWELKSSMTKQELDKNFNSLNITPEDVCSYQSMLVGLWRLKKSGVNILTSSERVFQKIKKLKGTLTQLIASKIEIELMKTPWSKTKNFDGAFRSNAMETINAEDGQVYRRRTRRSKTGQSAPTYKERIASTNKDLRTLTLNELKDNLMQFSVPLSKIKTLTRWQQVQLLAKLATHSKDLSDESAKHNVLVDRYARGPRNVYQASLDKYKAQYQSTFDSNLIYISSDENESEADSGNDALLDELGLEVVHNDLDDDDDVDLDLDNLEDDGTEKQDKALNVSMDDPPQLRPYSIYTYPSHVDWDSLGFENVPRRTIAKIINVSFTENGLELNINWERRREKIEELKRKKSNVYPAESPLDFREDVYKKRKKNLQKIKKWKLSTKQMPTNAPYKEFDNYFTEDLLVQDNKNNSQYCFVFSPKIKSQINRAAERFHEFERQISKRSYNSNAKDQSYDNDEQNDDEYHNRKTKLDKNIRKKKAKGSNPIEKFNHYCSKYLNLFNKFNHLQKYKEIEQKTKDAKYKKAEDFWRDMEALKPLTNEECSRKYDKNIVRHKERFMKLEKRIPNF